ncbi:hypothetical protein EDB83DRAFT_2314757 [Lactarius deliciosus]|nr:hypothetical protein EDB83DRAFT_2314757 [Lactarius deliciosus]
MLNATTLLPRKCDKLCVVALAFHTRVFENRSESARNAVDNRRVAAERQGKGVNQAPIRLRGPRKLSEMRRTGGAREQRRKNAVYIHQMLIFDGKVSGCVECYCSVKKRHNDHRLTVDRDYHGSAKPAWVAGKGLLGTGQGQRSQTLANPYPKLLQDYPVAAAIPTARRTPPSSSSSPSPFLLPCYIVPSLLLLLSPHRHIVVTITVVAIGRAWRGVA